MNSDEQFNGSSPKEVNGSDRYIITRSEVATGLPYDNYRQQLRYDFYYSCAYCTISESEATAIRFTIDHYEPRAARPDLVNVYFNLMYACDQCNQRKGDRYPPPEARANGYRFFRPDEDAFSTHFELTGMRLTAKTNIGEYSIEAMDLNRFSLRKLREIRERLTNCGKLVAEGVLALKKFHIDQLPPHVKGKVVGTINGAVAVANQMTDQIDDLLRNFARSPLVDPDPDGETRAKERSVRLGELKILYPGSWRAGQAREVLPSDMRSSSTRRRKRRR